jgi:hypothetical protein
MMSSAMTRTGRTASLARASVRMHGIDYPLGTLASYFAHGHPDLEGRIERLDPIRDQEVLLALTELVTRALWREYRMFNRAIRHEMAIDAVWFGLSAPAGCSDKGEVSLL